MSSKTNVDGLEFDDEFDPLAEEEELFLDSEMIDDDNPNDIEEMPIIPNMPEGIVEKGVFLASNYDDPRDAMRALFEKNPGRRPVYLSIIDMCKNGKPASQIAHDVDEIQKDNYSVYSPMTLCRALERAGALTVDIPESAEEAQGEDGVEYLEIKEEIDPIWTSTPEGLDILAQEQEGRAIRELLEKDGVYLEIYKRVLEFCNEKPRTKKEIDNIVDHDPLVQKPRRYSNHFIELLERTDALVWKNETWTITEIGKQTLRTL